MKIDFNDLNPAVFFPWDDGSDGGIEIRSISSRVLEEIDKKTIKKKMVIRKGQRFQEEVVDTKLRNSLMWDYCIVNWTGLKDQDDAEVPCNKENKDILMQDRPGFGLFVAGCMNNLVEYESEEEEVLEKN